MLFEISRETNFYLILSLSFRIDFLDVLMDEKENHSKND